MFLRRALCTAVRSGGGVCASPPRPPCPPCEPQPAPPCRQPPGPPRRAAERRVCCPPPQGLAPPCAPPPPACPRSCSTQAQRAAPPRCDPCQERKKARMSEACGDALDEVTVRLRAASAARREDYEREVQQRAAAAARAPPRPYQPLGERARVTFPDGNTYSLACAPPPPPPCGPARQPPPPTPLTVLNDDQCRRRPANYRNPCAHKPVELIQIDRSGGTAARNTASAATPRCPPQEKVNTPKIAEQKTEQCSVPSKGITSRIMETFNLGTKKGTRCARVPCPPACPVEEGAARAGDRAWCGRGPRGKPTVPCREPTLAERLRWKSGQSRCGDKRELHTTPRTSADAGRGGGLAGLQAERAALPAAALGRALPPPCKPPPPPPAEVLAGRFEMGMPCAEPDDHLRIDVFTIPRNRTEPESLGCPKTSPSQPNLNNDNKTPPTASSPCMAKQTAATSARCKTASKKTSCTSSSSSKPLCESKSKPLPQKKSTASSTNTCNKKDKAMTQAEKKDSWLSSFQNKLTGKGIECPSKDQPKPQSKGSKPLPGCPAPPPKRS